MADSIVRLSEGLFLLFLVIVSIYPSIWYVGVWMKHKRSLRCNKWVSARIISYKEKKVGIKRKVVFIPIYQYAVEGKIFESNGYKRYGDIRPDIGLIVDIKYYIGNPKVIYDIEEPMFYKLICSFVMGIIMLCILSLIIVIMNG